ncbi:MAG: DUF4328 domain-containing protein [Verrucomicrobia bacterium]|nr:DUF4328 domain-containing protein [Verrucomicrobiota bacterium]MBV8376585.1 DUF4328 domain-containing protein [Verrucomicrobiota bacterium]
MDAIYLRYPDGQMTQRSEEEARRLWRDGLMPSGTIYWQEGMPDWKPVTLWLGEPKVVLERPLPDDSQAGFSSYQFLLDPAGLTKFLQRLLWISVLVACIALVDDLAEFVQVQIGQLSPDQVANNDPVQGIIGLLQSGLGIVTGITFLKWIYRAYKNIQGFGAEGLRFSPGWAVGYYFIPILSLIRPVQVMGEIWRASDDPRDWQRKPGSWLITSWWTLFLLYTGVTQVSLEVAIQASTNDQWTLAAVLAILGDLFSIPLSIAALRLVTEVYRRQQELVVAVGAM